MNENSRKAAFVALFVSLALMSAQPLTAVEIRTTYESIQKTLAREVFTDKERYYLSGDSGSKCDYAYLEWPEVSGSNGRINLRVHFSGRKAAEALGKCIGPGDAFYVNFSGQPYAKDGVLGLRNIEMKIEDSNFLRDKLEDFARDRLPKLVEFDLKKELLRHLAEANKSSPYTIGIHDLAIRTPRVEPQHLVMAVDFRLDVTVK